MYKVSNLSNQEKGLKIFSGTGIQGSQIQCILPNRFYSFTMRHPLMVVGTADRNLIVFNLQNPLTEFKRITSPLKYQTRCVAAFPDQQVDRSDPRKAISWFWSAIMLGTWLIVP
ncbi:protein RAE1-like [Quercus lobata]|uniref:protein RAE1-like n=1 Tax=Quercus lobata TaxID=97700 RepID=UPI0012454212|nr:protein RAE1-like [Quercus lobata]